MPVQGVAVPLHGCVLRFEAHEGFLDAFLGPLGGLLGPSAGALGGAVFGAMLLPSSPEQAWLNHAEAVWAGLWGHL